MQLEYQKKWMAKRRNKWIEENGPCVDCGGNSGLEMDHVDPSKKVSHRIWTWADERRIPELAKCVVRCRKCHRRKTSKEQSERFSKPIRHGSTFSYLQKKCKCEVCRAFYKKWRRCKYERIGK